MVALRQASEEVDHIVLVDALGLLQMVVQLAVLGRGCSEHRTVLATVDSRLEFERVSGIAPNLMSCWDTFSAEDDGIHEEEESTFREADAYLLLEMFDVFLLLFSRGWIGTSKSLPDYCVVDAPSLV